MTPKHPVLNMHYG